MFFACPNSPVLETRRPAANRTTDTDSYHSLDGGYTMNTYIPSTDKIEKKWYVVDPAQTRLRRNGM